MGVSLNILKAFKAGLAATREKYLAAFGGHKGQPEAALKALEAGLYAADFGPQWIRETLTILSHSPDQDPVEGIKKRLYEQLNGADGRLPFDADLPQAVVLLGVNGVGKTTTAAKIAFFLKQSHRKVLLGSC
ncbi:MAG: hypothetical protein LBR62_00670, partial [Puniceicoccales bacterium]|nr:hypothetical protein [Puniceicoccales bacterium]